MPSSDWEPKWAGYVERYGTQSSATWVVECPWSDHSDVADALYESTHSEMSNLVCRSIDCEPVGDPDPVAGGFKTAKLTLRFEDTTQQEQPPTGATKSDWGNWLEHWEGGGQAVTVGEGFLFSDAALASDCTPIKSTDGVSAVKIVPQATISITGTTSPYVDISVGKRIIAATMGKVNSGNFTLKGFVYSDQQLLFLGADLDETKTPKRQTVHNMTMKFQAVYDHNWNQVYRRRPNPGWVRVIKSDSTYGMYDPCTTFSDLNPAAWSV